MGWASLEGFEDSGGGVPPMPSGRRGWPGQGLDGDTPGRVRHPQPPEPTGRVPHAPNRPVRRGEEIRAETSRAMLAGRRRPLPSPPLAKGGLGGVVLARPLGILVGFPSCELVRVDLDCERPRPTPPCEGGKGFAREGPSAGDRDDLRVQRTPRPTPPSGRRHGEIAHRCPPTQPSPTKGEGSKLSLTLPCGEGQGGVLKIRWSGATEFPPVLFRFLACSRP